MYFSSAPNLAQCRIDRCKACKWYCPYGRHNLYFFSWNDTLHKIKARARVDLTNFNKISTFWQTDFNEAKFTRFSSSTCKIKLKKHDCEVREHSLLSFSFRPRRKTKTTLSHVRRSYFAHSEKQRGCEIFSLCCISTIFSCFSVVFRSLTSLVPLMLT